MTTADADARPGARTGPDLRAIVIAAGSHIFRAAHVPALLANGVQVVAVFDAEASRAAAVASEHGWPVTADLDALLGLDADAAIICAPHPLHAHLVTRCLDAGLSVLVEKPLAPRLSEIDAISAAATESGRDVAVVHQHRMRAEVVEAERMILAGDLGRIHRAVVVASYPKRSNYYTDTPWRGTWEGEGGGVLLNQGLHDIDLLVHLLGRPERVTASLRTLVHPIETEDTVDALVEWGDGASASVHITSAARLDANRIEIFGSRRAIRLSAEGLEVRTADEDFLDFSAGSGGHFDAFPVSDWRRSVAPDGGTHRDVYADFVRASASHRPPAISPGEARGAVEVIAAAALSSAKHGSVTLPVDPAEYDAFLDARIAASAGRKGERIHA